MKKIGYIYACIAGDHNYGTTITVRTDGKKIEVVHEGTTPVGGMDGPRESVHRDVDVIDTLDATAKDVEGLLIRKLKRAFKKVDAGTVASYGKPTKNFVWYVMTEDGIESVKGLSAKLAKDAIRTAREP